MKTLECSTLCPRFSLPCPGPGSLGDEATLCQALPHTSLPDRWHCTTKCRRPGELTIKLKWKSSGRCSQRRHHHDPRLRLDFDDADSCESPQARNHNNKIRNSKLVLSRWCASGSRGDQRRNAGPAYLQPSCKALSVTTVGRLPAGDNAAVCTAATREMVHC
jgi:hypothetical protein